SRMLNPSDCDVELNSIMRGTRVDRLSGMIPADATQAQLPQIARRCLLRFWKDDEIDFLVPGRPPTSLKPTPDEVVIRAPDGRAVYRWTIVEEKMERWFAEGARPAGRTPRVMARAAYASSARGGPGLPRPAWGQVEDKGDALNSLGRRTGEAGH